MRVVRLARVLKGGGGGSDANEQTGNGLRDRLTEEAIRRRPEAFQGPTAESNWVIPDRLLVGAYPNEYTQGGTVQSKNDPVLQSLLRQGVTTFVCLQKEYHHDTTRFGTMYHPYIVDAWRLCDEREDLPDANKIRLLHLPIEDCSCGEDKMVLQLCVHLSYTVVLRRDELVYIHCWGGHGRTGTMVAIILGLLYDLDSREALKLTQLLHNVRRSDSQVPSPQTEKQRKQVTALLGSKQACKVKRNLRVLQDKLSKTKAEQPQVSQQLSVFDVCVHPAEFHRKESDTQQPTRTRTKTVQNHQRFFNLARRIKQHSKAPGKPTTGLLQEPNSPRAWSSAWRNLNIIPARPKPPPATWRKTSPRANVVQYKPRGILPTEQEECNQSKMHEQEGVARGGK